MTQWNAVFSWSWTMRSSEIGPCPWLKKSCANSWILVTYCSRSSFFFRIQKLACITCPSEPSAARMFCGPMVPSDTAARSSVSLMPWSLFLRKPSINRASRPPGACVNAALDGSSRITSLMLARWTCFLSRENRGLIPCSRMVVVSSMEHECDRLLAERLALFHRLRRRSSHPKLRLSGAHNPRVACWIWRGSCAREVLTTGDHSPVLGVGNVASRCIAVVPWIRAQRDANDAASHIQFHSLVVVERCTISSDSVVCCLGCEVVNPRVGTMAPFCSRSYFVPS